MTSSFSSNTRLKGNGSCGLLNLKNSFFQCVLDFSLKFMWFSFLFICSSVAIQQPQMHLLAFTVLMLLFAPVVNVYLQPGGFQNGWLRRYRLITCSCFAGITVAPVRLKVKPQEEALHPFLGQKILLTQICMLQIQPAVFSHRLAAGLCHALVYTNV